MLPILDLYYGDHLINAASKAQTSFFSGLFSSGYIYIIGIFLFFYIFFIITFFIRPLMKKNPLKYYKRYLEIREEMEKIDELYNKKKITFPDYSYAQFNYAKEYEMIIVFLSKFPEYKQRLESYQLKGSQVKVKQESFEEKKDQVRLNQINFLTDLLLPKAKYYTEEEIEQAILDEGFNKEISYFVVNKLKRQGIEFGSEKLDKTNKVVDLVNKIFPTKETEEGDLLGQTNESIDLKKTVYSKPANNSNYVNQIDFSDSDNFNKDQEKNKESIFENLKNLLKPAPKKKEHSISEINDIFKDIEKSLNK
jgi:hypothetical protein